MKKYVITESQLNLVKSKLQENNLRSYVFDWDDNILYMPTTIKMDVSTSGGWEPIDVSTEDYSKVRTDSNYRLRDNDPNIAFKDFRDSKSFIRDIKKALENKMFAPSYDKFKEALIFANPFGVNTARSHKPQTLRDGVKFFIDKTFTEEEKEKMVSNIKKNVRSIKDLNDEQTIDFYLDEMGEYYPVSSKEFGQRFGIDTSLTASNPEHAKKIAIEHFIKKVFDNVKTLVNSDYKKMSLGFSDDDVRNIRSMELFIEEELNKMYPEFHFVVYDTSEKGKRKMVIEKE